MRLGIVAAFTGALLLFQVSESAAGESMRFEFLEVPSNDGDLYLWPLNLHLGAVVVADRTAQAAGPSVGLDFMRFSYKSLVVDTVSFRMAFRDACGRLADCGIGADFFVGSRAFYAAYVGSSGDHRFLFGGGVGWGSVGGGFGGRTSGDDGQFILKPAVAYEFIGLFGLEVAALLPVNNLGDTYPAAITFNILGLGSALALLYGGR